MSLKNGVKCGRCDRRYSSLRSRCPYCGARRSKATKRVSSSDSSTWKTVVGLLILVLLIAAVVVLLVTTLKDAKATAPGKATIDPDQILEEAEEPDSYSQSEGVTSEIDNTEPVIDLPEEGDLVQPVDEGTEGTQVQPVVQSVVMKYLGSELTKSSDPSYDYDVSMKVTDRLNLTFSTDPEVETVDFEWSSSDEDVAMVLQSGQLTAVGKGTAKIMLTVEGVSKVCVVRVS